MKKTLLVLLALFLTLGLFVSCEEEPKVYTVHFEMNGYGEPLSDLIVTNGRPSYLPEEPICDDYSFEGWYTDEGLENLFSLVNLPSGDTDMTLYAKWTRIYTVTFKANGGTGTMADERMVAGTYALPENGFTSTVVSFVGWSTTADGPAIASTTIEITQDTTLYAKWSGIKTEDQLKAAFSNGGSYYLDADIKFTTGTEDYACFLLKKNKELELDLNGYVIDAGQQERVIKTYGSLTILDSNPTRTHADYQEKDAKFPKGGVIYNGQSTENGFGAGISVRAGGALNFSSGTIYHCSTTASGGAIATEASSDLTITGGSIVGCSAGLNGGAIFNVSEEPKISNLSIIECTANCAGGIYTYQTVTNVNLTDVTIADCTATSGNAGGIYNAAKAASLKNVSVSGCSSGKWGGGLFFNNTCASASLESVTVSGCEATNYGGGIYFSGAEDSQATLDDVQILSCTGRYGGGLYLTSDQTLTMKNGSSITGCHSVLRVGNSNPAYGGAVAIYGTLIMDGTEKAITITGNTCENHDDTNSRSSAVQIDGTLVVKGKVDISGNEILLKGGSSSDPKVYGNVRIYGTGIIQVEEEGLAEGSKIGVRTATLPTEGVPAAITSGKKMSASDLAFFSSDYSGYEVYIDEDIVKLKIKEAD